MFREIILPIFRTTRPCVTACGIMHPRCCRPQAYALEPEKGKLVIMTIACLHDFFIRSPDSAAVYTPPGMLDYEENGRVIEGSWRAISNENTTSLFPIRKIAR